MSVKKTRLVVYLKNEQYKKLVTVSDRLQVPLSSIVAQSLDRWIPHVEQWAKEKELEGSSLAAPKRNGKPPKEQET